MLEKLGIRIATSLVVLWYIVQMNHIKVSMDVYIYIMLLLNACFVALIIEYGYEILRKKIQHTPLFFAIMIMVVVLTFVMLGSGIYIFTLIYVFLSIGIQLYREYHLTNLLKLSLKNDVDCKG